MVRLLSRLGVLALAASYVANSMLLVCWFSSRVAEDGTVCFFSHGKEFVLPVPPLKDAPMLFGALLLVLVAQVGALLWVGLRGNKSATKRE